jgi:NitT/TauT family transport system substrate-binding protein
MRQIIAAGLAAAGLLLVGCTSPVASSPASGPASSAPGSHSGPRSPVGPPGTRASGALRLGLTEGIADAPALVGWQTGLFGQNLGKVTLEPMPFTSTAAEVTALEQGQLDAAYLDPVAALQAWQSAPGGLIRIVAGAASGGAELVVARRITSIAQLNGRRLAAPAGGAQQAAADFWLRQHGLPAAEASASADAGVLQEFQSGKIAGGWEPPPLDVQLAAAGGRVLVNEASLWPHGQFPTSVLAVTQRFLAANPAAVTGLLKGHVQASEFLTANRASAQAAVAQRLTALGNSLPPGVIAQSFAQLTFTSDPLPGPTLAEAQHAIAARMLKPLTDLARVYDLGPLNKVLKAAGQQPVGA